MPEVASVPLQLDRDRMVVPAVEVGFAREARGDRRRRVVDLDAVVSTVVVAGGHSWRSRSPSYRSSGPG